MIPYPIAHQYIDRETSRVTTEHLIADPFINRLYSRAKESAPLMFRAARESDWWP